MVASEVKSLAVQTEQATEEVSLHIAAIQGSTAAAVDAIRKIAGRTAEVRNYMTSATSAAQRSRNAATSQITQNVSDAAGATKEIAAVLIVWWREPQTRPMPQHKQSWAASTALESASAELRREVETFLRKVAA